MENIEISPVSKKPPKHFADLSPEDRAIAVAELGEPAFRAKQLANHYFGRHSENPKGWSESLLRAPRNWQQHSSQLCSLQYVQLLAMVEVLEKIFGNYMMA